MILGISGKAGAGKDTVCKMIVYGDEECKISEKERPAVCWTAVWLHV